MKPEDLILPRDPSLTNEKVMQMLEDAASAPQPEAVERAVTSAHQVGVREEFVPPLLSLLRSTDHFRHEDIVNALQDIKDPRAVEGLFDAATVTHEYLAYDEFFGLARKCTWALADIGTPEAKARLVQLAASENPLIAGYAKKRLDRWHDEQNSKRG
ncbi:HEAT repeat domain-containing protein [Lacipirellula limnantheis]|uniref:HEAT repeat protein n=1 Tax=Lacipirellula limnantheis TaxID=2528024 RepID=A0A517TTH8_9BACT|nr:hypothetical protein [Lacipirellula limnantheis]QDT71662.1 hypothetical protein I41_08220 [Lacipirellula limnantheis]